MEWVEVTGKTVEEAKEAALDTLGVDEADAEFEVLEEPRSGLFGRLRSEARVRARVRPTKPRAKEERRGRGGSRSRGGGNGRRERQQPSPAGAPPKQDEDREQEDTQDVSDDRSDAAVADVPVAEQGEVAKAFLEGVLERMDIDATVAVTEIDEDTVEVGVTGQDLGLLIGPRGSALAALQDLARTVVQRKTGARTGRLLVDVAGYRQRRREALERFTRQVADEVVSSGQARRLEPMSPADRKVVHDTANTIDGVTTSSEGEEPRRRVVIAPSS